MKVLKTLSLVLAFSFMSYVLAVSGSYGVNIRNSSGNISHQITDTGRMTAADSCSITYGGHCEDLTWADSDVCTERAFEEDCGTPSGDAIIIEDSSNSQVAYFEDGGQFCTNGDIFELHAMTGVCTGSSYNVKDNAGNLVWCMEDDGDVYAKEQILCGFAPVKCLGGGPHDCTDYPDICEAGYGTCVWNIVYGGFCESGTFTCNGISDSQPNCDATADCRWVEYL